MTAPEAFSAIAFVLTVALFWPYYRAIQRGETLPHVLSWSIWAGGTFLVFLAQLAGGAGLGAWPIGFSALLTAGVAVMAYRRRQRLVITRFDWVCFALAALALPAWIASSEPLVAVVLLTLADLLGFGPTLRRAYVQPYAEHLGFFALGAVRNAFVLAALEAWNWTTVLFPLAVGIACVLVAAVLAWRRRFVQPGAHHST